MRSVTQIDTIVVYDSKSVIMPRDERHYNGRLNFNAQWEKMRQKKKKKPETRQKDFLFHLEGKPNDKHMHEASTTAENANLSYVKDRGRLIKSEVPFRQKRI